jgi:hypothetical protein
MTRRIKSKSDGNIALYVNGGFANSETLLSDVIEAINSLKIDIAKLKNNTHPRGPHDIVFRPQEKPVKILRCRMPSNGEITPSRKAKRDDLAEMLGQKKCVACNPLDPKCKKCSGTGYAKEKK